MDTRLLEIREKIDRVDKELVRLFEERMKLCEDVAEYKCSVGKAVYDGKREAEKIQKVQTLAHGEFNERCVGEMFRHLMSMSRKLQLQIQEEKAAAIKKERREEPQCKQNKPLPGDTVKVVFQGIPGAYGYQAMRGYFGESADSFHVDTFREAMEKVREGEADYAILPMENSSAGIVGDVYDLLMEYDNYIVDTYDLPVRHSLLGTADSTMDCVRTVYSHPQAIAQCSHFLEEHPDWTAEKRLNTAVSAYYVGQECDKTKAAIAGKINAELYGLKVLKENIQNVNTNTTRFAVIRKEPVYGNTSSRICVCFEVKHESGSLYYALSNLIYNNINMTKIESRPIPERPFQYRFYVEMEGNLGMPEIKNALRGMEEETVSFQVLGNY